MTRASTTLQDEDFASVLAVGGYRVVQQDTTEARGGVPARWQIVKSVVVKRRRCAASVSGPCSPSCGPHASASLANTAPGSCTARAHGTAAVAAVAQPADEEEHEFMLLLLPGHLDLDMDKARAQLGGEVQWATEQEVMAATGGLAAGVVHPLVPISSKVLDHRILDSDPVCFSTGDAAAGGIVVPQQLFLASLGPSLRVANLCRDPLEHALQLAARLDVSPHDATFICENGVVQLFEDMVTRYACDARVALEWLRHLHRFANSRKPPRPMLSISDAAWFSELVMSPASRYARTQALLTALDTGILGRIPHAAADTGEGSTSSSGGGATSGSDDSSSSGSSATTERGGDRLGRVISDVLAGHSNLYNNYRAGQEGPVNFVVGQVMRRTVGVFNPKDVRARACKALAAGPLPLAEGATVPAASVRDL